MHTGYRSGETTPVTEVYVDVDSFGVSVEVRQGKSGNLIDHPFDVAQNRSAQVVGRQSAAAPLGCTKIRRAASSQAREKHSVTQSPGGQWIELGCQRIRDVVVEFRYPDAEALAQKTTRGMYQEVHQVGEVHFLRMHLG